MLLETLYEVGDDELAPLKQCNIWVKSILNRLDDIDNRLHSERDSL